MQFMENKDHFYVRANRSLARIYFNELIRVEALQNYVVLHTIKDRHIVHATMKELEEMLPTDQFFKVHRSHIIRLDKVKSIEQNKLMLDDKVVPIARSYKNKFLRQLLIL